MCLFLAHSDGNVRGVEHIPVRLVERRYFSAAPPRERVLRHAAHFRRLGGPNRRDSAASPVMPRIPNV